MNKNIIICENKSCPNNTGKGCDRTFVTLSDAGVCISANQRPTGREDDADDLSKEREVLLAAGVIKAYCEEHLCSDCPLWATGCTEKPIEWRIRDE